MNRLITGSIGILSFVFVLFAAGCAAEQSTEEEQQQQATQDSDIVASGASQAKEGTGTTAIARDTHPPTEMLCFGCGPLPDPWQMGPLPDPWSSSSGGSSGKGTGGSSGKGGGGKP